MCPLPSISIDFPPMLIFVHMHVDPLPLTLQLPTHLPDIPTPVPWGCYVHTWNGCVGLCPSPLFGCCCMHPGCSTVVKHVLSPAEQAHTSSCALIISLDDFHCPAIDFQVAITFFIKLSLTFSIFMHVCTSWPVPSTSLHIPFHVTWGDFDVDFCAHTWT